MYTLISIKKIYIYICVYVFVFIKSKIICWKDELILCKHKLVFWMRLTALIILFLLLSICLHCQEKKIQWKCNFVPPNKVNKVKCRLCNAVSSYISESRTKTFWTPAFLYNMKWYKEHFLLLFYFLQEWAQTFAFLHK